MSCFSGRFSTQRRKGNKGYERALGDRESQAWEQMRSEFNQEHRCPAPIRGQTKPSEPTLVEPLSATGTDQPGQPTQCARNEIDQHRRGK